MMLLLPLRLLDDAFGLFGWRGRGSDGIASSAIWTIIIVAIVIPTTIIVVVGISIRRRLLPSATSTAASSIVILLPSLPMPSHKPAHHFADFEAAANFGDGFQQFDEVLGRVDGDGAREGSDVLAAEDVLEETEISTPRVEIEIQLGRRTENLKQRGNSFIHGYHLHIAVRFVGR